MAIFNIPKLIIVAIVYFIFFESVQSQPINDYLILKNPSDFRIFNKYEQKVSTTDSLILTANCPLQILYADTLLSDGYTPCSITQLENKLYFLLKDDQHQPVDQINPYNSLLIKNAAVLNDTIQIISSRGLVIHSPFKNGKEQYLQENTKLLRLFNKRKRTYVKTLTGPNIYGWINLKNKNKWKKIKPAIKSNLNNDIDVESIISERLENVNNLLYKLFLHFNEIKKSDVNAPYWHLEKIGNRFECKMMNKPENTDFSESTNLLISDLQLSLSHLNYIINLQGDKIIIAKKTN